MGEQAVLIHDSQGDRGSFVRDLRDAYEQLQRSSSTGDGDHVARRIVDSMVPVLGELDHYSRGLRRQLGDAPINVLQLLERLIELKRFSVGLDASDEDMLPSYGVWHTHGDAVRRVGEVLHDLGMRRALGASPLASSQSALPHRGNSRGADPSGVAGARGIHP